MAFLGDLLIRLKADSADFVNDLGKAANQTERFMRDVQRSFTSVNGALAALGASVSVAGGVLAMRSTLEGAENTYKLSQKIGMAVEDLSRFEYAAKLSDLSNEALTTGIKKLSTAMVEAASGSKEAKGAFAAMGVSIYDANGNLKSSQEVMLALAERFSTMSGSAEKSALAVKLFGKSGLDLIPFLNQGRAGIEALMAEADKLGIVWSTQTAKSAEEFNDNLKRLSENTRGLLVQLAGGLLPLMLDVQKRYLDAATATGSFNSKLKETFAQQNKMEEWAEGVAKGVAIFLDNLVELRRAIIDIATPFERLGRNIYNFGAAMSIVYAPNLGWQERVDALVRLRDESEAYFKSLDDRLKNNKKVAPGETYEAQVAKYFADRRRRRDLEAIYGPPGDPAGDAKKFTPDLSLLKPKGLTEEQELKMFLNALQSLEKQYFNLTNAGQVAITTYETEKGSLRELTETHKKELIEKARQIEAYKTAQEMRKQAIEGYEQEARALDKIKNLLQEYRQANRDTLGQMKFDKSLIGLSEFEKQKAQAMREIDLELKRRAEEIPQGEDGMMASSMEALLRLKEEAEKQKRAVLQSLEERRAAERDWLTGVREGLYTYIDMATNAAQQVSNAISNGFRAAEDALVKFVRTGKLDFKSFADSVINDIIRIYVRQQILAPFAQMMGGGAPGYGGGIFGGGGGLFGGGNFLSNLFGGRELFANPIAAIGMQGFASGTDYVTHDQVAKIHQGEAIIPAHENMRGRRQEPSMVVNADLRGADVAAVQRLEAFVMRMHATLEQRAIDAVFSEQLKGNRV